jgi:DNA-binding NarL/FixJ family response regulator
MAMQVAAEHSRSRIAVADLGEPRRLRVVVADGSSLSMTVVLSLLEYHELVDMIGRVANFEEMIQLVANHQPDLVLIDLDMPLANLAIPAIILCAHSSVKIVGMCTGETIPSQHLDMVTTVNALIHKERLSEEFATVVDALYSGGPALNAISLPRKVDQVIDRAVVWAMQPDYSSIVHSRRNNEHETATRPCSGRRDCNFRVGPDSAQTSQPGRNG